MFTLGFKWHFICLLSALFAALCLLSSTSLGQSDEDGAPPPTPSTIQTDSNPLAVEQALVPEGVFAMQLAEALKLGPLPDEAKAEELLSGLGIEPKSGWISEYPVTPVVLGDIMKGISVASDQKKIALAKDQALKLLSDVKARFGFDVNPGAKAPDGLIESPGNRTIYSYTDSKGVVHFTDVYDSIPKEYQKEAKKISQSTQHELSGGAGSGTTDAPGPQYLANPNPEVINNYYYDQGPPVVTYYSPPGPYHYLYSWVPYPFWSTGFYFPGFFVLNNFHRHVFFNRQSYIVTHHIGNGAFQRPLSVGPVNPTWAGHLTPEVVAHSRWFSSPNAQTSARNIVSLNQNRNHLINETTSSRRDVSRQSFLSAGNPGNLGNPRDVPTSSVTMQNNQYRSPLYSGDRAFNQRAFNQRAYVPETPRFYSPPVFVQNREFRSQHSFGEGFPGGFHRGGGEGGEFHGGGNLMRQGGSFAGASRGGHR